MDVVIVQESPQVGPGLLVGILAERRRATRIVRLDEGQAPPTSTDGLRALVLLTGDETLVPLVRACVDEDVPILGIGAGAQLLAAATGGAFKAEPGSQALGYVPLVRTDEAEDDPVLDAYPDGTAALSLDQGAFTLGAEAVPLARRPDGALAAFRAAERAYGLVFFPQLTADDVAVLAPTIDVEDPEALVLQARLRDRFHQGMGAGVLGRWVDAVVGRTDEEKPWGRRGPQPVPAPGLSLHPA